jgi:hypothetical protein
MKNKNRILLFAAAFLFLNVFFVKVDSANNVAKAETCDECASACSSWATGSDGVIDTASDNECFNSDCASLCDSGATTTPVDNFSSLPGYDPQVLAKCNADGGEMDPTDGKCYCPANKPPNAAGVCTTPSCYDACILSGNSSFECNNECNGSSVPVAGTEASCNTVSGYWKLGTCYASKDDYCAQTMGPNYTMNALTGNCTGDKGAECTTSSDCGTGKSCREATKDAACGVNSIGCVCCSTSFLGMGGDCTAAASGTSAPTQQQTITTTAPTNIINKSTGQPVAVPAGSTINTATGAVYGSDGSQLLPAGSVQMPSSLTSGSGSGFVMCANGILASECRDGNGNSIGGAPIVLGSSSIGGGLPVSYGGGSGGVQAPKCGANFQDIGGVCFPMNTGLSSTPIYVIVSNIFSWLMGLFTTLAVLAFVISGVQYFMSSGDESMAEKAKENATNAIVGIIVGLSGFIIIKAIAAALSGQSMFF